MEQGWSNSVVSEMVKLQSVVFKILHLVCNEKSRSNNFSSIPASNKCSLIDLKSH